MKNLFICIFSLIALAGHSQTVYKTAPFSLTSPFMEPDGRNDVIHLPNNDFITIAKVKGATSGASEFALERYNADLENKWKTPLNAENSEDYKELYHNGKEIILLSVIHKEKEKKTQLVAYAYDENTGKQLWNKEMENYDVEDWELHPHKGRVKESFTDIVCEHVDANFVTPFEYKHHINFSPDQSKLVSYIYNYGEKTLTASIAVYDNSCNLLKKGKISIDNDYTNHGFYVNNEGIIFMVNANSFSKLNIIRYNLDTKNFDILEIPGSNYLKDDFQVRLESNDKLLVANTENSQGKILGVLISSFDFKEQKVDEKFTLFPDAMKAQILSDRKANKNLHGEEDWKDYDINNFVSFPDKSILVTLEKRVLYSDGYPHISRDVFDKTHKEQIDGHVNAEGIIFMVFNPDGSLKWNKFIPKNQVYPAVDGLNTISFSLNTSTKDIQLLYSYSESMDPNLHNIRFISIDRLTGSVLKDVSLPNEDKLTLIRDFTIWHPDGLTVVGKKGMIGKKSNLVRYKL